MAQIDCRDGVGGVFTVWDEVLEVLLDNRREWSLYHTGKSSSGADATDTIFMMDTGDNPQTHYGDKRGCIPMEAGNTYPIRNGLRSIKLQCTSGGQASFLLIPGARIAGSPTA